jgi:hypothetical protein
VDSRKSIASLASLRGRKRKENGERSRRDGRGGRKGGEEKGRGETTKGNREICRRASRRPRRATVKTKDSFLDSETKLNPLSPSEDRTRMVVSLEGRREK